MDLDDHICYCYHVSLRKLVNFARRTRPRCASQMADCLGAGTGCGWCIPFLRKIVAAQNEGEPFKLPLSPERYAAARADYRQDADRCNTFEDDAAPLP